MPIVTIKIAKGRPIETKRKLVQSVAEAVASSLNVKAELVSVLIDEFERENWSTGGKLHSDKYTTQYNQSRRKLIPCFDDFYRIAVEIIPFKKAGVTVRNTGNI